MEDLKKAIGDANSKSVVENFDKIRRLRYLEGRIDFGVASTESKGKVAITGKLSVKRSQFEEELKKAGYTPGDISKDTKFLITDDPTSNSSKNIKADKFGVTKITESEFRSKYM